MTAWHILLYAAATFLALRSFIQLAERRTANRTRNLPDAGSGLEKTAV
jgi:hypothetical protein